MALRFATPSLPSGPTESAHSKLSVTFGTRRGGEKHVDSPGSPGYFTHPRDSLKTPTVRLW